MKPYRRLIAEKHVVRLLLGGTIARFPLSMMPLSLLLVSYSYVGSFAFAGLVAGLHGLASAVVAPFAGRIIDRTGPRKLLLLTAFSYPVLVGCVLVVFSAGYPFPVVLVTTIIAGTALPTVGPVVRSAWANLGDPTLKQAAYSLEAAVIELVYITGPALVAVLTFIASPQWAVGVASVCASVGAFLVATSSRFANVSENQDENRRRRSPLRSPSLVCVLLAVFFVLFAMGTLDVAITAFVGGAGVAGLLLAIWAAGSAIGGLWFGMQHIGFRTDVVYRWALLALAVTHLPLMLAAKATTLAVLLIFAGMTIAPVMALQAAVVSEVAPKGTEIEAQTWVTTIGYMGLAMGAAAGGAMAEQRWGADGAVILGACAPVLAFLVSTVGYRLYAGRNRE